MTARSDSLPCALFRPVSEGLVNGAQERGSFHGAPVNDVVLHPGLLHLTVGKVQRHGQHDRRILLQSIADDLSIGGTDDDNIPLAAVQCTVKLRGSRYRCRSIADL